MLAVSLGLSVMVATSPAASATVLPPTSMHTPGDDMTDSPLSPALSAMNDEAATPDASVAPGPSEAPMHDMEPVTGDTGAPEMAGHSHEATSPTPGTGDATSPSVAPDTHDTGDGHGDEMTDMTSNDSGGHDGGPAAVTAPPEQQRKVVLAGFVAINLLVLAGAGILRRRGHGSRGQQRAKQGPTTTPRRTGAAKEDTGDQV